MFEERPYHAVSRQAAGLGACAQTAGVLALRFPMGERRNLGVGIGGSLEDFLGRSAIRYSGQEDEPDAAIPLGARGASLLGGDPFRGGGRIEIPPACPGQCPTGTTYLAWGIGLVVTIIVWKAHTIVDKGLVQLWRYGRGGTSFKPSSRREGPAA